MSPMGLHGYRSVTVPYCQFLFPEEMIHDFIYEKGLKQINYDHVNKWSLKDYRKLWDKYSGRLEKVRYHEGLNVSHLDLIMKYPSCFRSKTKFFDNLVASSISVLFKKIK